MSILSSIKKGISKVKSLVSPTKTTSTSTLPKLSSVSYNPANIAKASALAASPVGQALSAATKSNAIGGVTTPSMIMPKTATPTKTSSTIGGFTPVSWTGEAGKIDAVTGKVNPATGGTNYTLSTNGTVTAPSVTKLSSATAPSTISSISTVGTPGVTSTNMGMGNIAPAVASVNGIQARIDAQMAADAEAQQAKKEADALRAQQEKENKSIFRFLNNNDNIRETTADDAWRETGIKPREYFADQRARIAEIDTLTQNYNAVVAQRDAQIAQTNDKLASMNFINNQVAQINRNAAPVLNQMSANINAKAATMQALQGNFAEAQKFVNQAVDDAVADKKDKVDSFKMFYDINQNSIDKLDSKYKDALNQASAIAEIEYKQAYDDKKLLGDLMIANPNAGIDILRDTPDDAYAKIARSGGSTDYKLAVSQENRLSGKTGTEDKPATTSDIDWAKSQIGFGDLQIPYGTTQSGLSTIAALDWSDPVTKSNYKNNVDGFKTWVTSVLQGNLK